MVEKHPKSPVAADALSALAFCRRDQGRLPDAIKAAQQFTAAYTENLANFIRDARKELGIEKLPFVIAETGMSGHGETHPRALSLMRAQAAVAKHAEFRGNVAFVGTKDFYRPSEASPSRQAYHWNSNAETYYLIGAAMGEAMKKLCEQ